VASGSTPGRSRRFPLSAERTALEALRDRPLNLDLSKRGEWTEARGWRVDDYRQPLPEEAPGPPEPGGTWQRACRIMRDYAFADPAIVHAVYDRDTPLEGRNILLGVRFWGLRFSFGVRVGRVTDETRVVDGREIRVWGWNYATLQGHLERGEMGYEVWKWLDTGAIEFRIHVVSRASRTGNLIVRLGFRIFGRREQVRFARRALERMACLVREDPGVPSRSFAA
jgi:uncharacterized protein (UPF0548 family)